MERFEFLITQVEKVQFNERLSCIEVLDNKLQDILFYLEAMDHRASGELLELRGCSWVLHERYHMDNEEQFKWTFHHTKHKILRSCQSLLDSKRLKGKSHVEKKEEMMTQLVAE